MKTPVLAKQLLKTSRIFECSPDETLSKAAAKLESSHDAVFVVDGGKVLGVINPYHCLYSTKYPGSTKVENCLFHPPHIHESTTIDEIARQMLESKIYFLPVFDNKDDWLGVVSVRRIMTAVSNFKEIREAMPRLTLKKKMVVIDLDSNLSDAHALLKNRGLSRLPVVDGNKTLIGLITRYDLKEVLTEPEMSQRRFSRKGNKQKKLDQPIAGYINRRVITASETEGLKPIMDMMLDNEVGSVIIIDNDGSPVGIVSYKDILKLVAKIEVV